MTKGIKDNKITNGDIVMDNKERLSRIKGNKYREIFGVNKEIFEEMLKILETAYKEEHKKGGRPSVLSVLDKLVIMLQYYREYRTMEHIAFDYGTNKSTVCDAVHWAEKTIIKDERYHLPSKKRLIEDDTIKEIAVDATETEIERPQKNRKITTQARKKDIH